ncbi:hypothetical protein GJ744_009160 [Endocarpon pusillum]|uniref:Fungal N-terminal domain-containing protein n=1 Tax=Endocarpon pusillum TaxID=364733 RepID=A0A8H7AKC5_9EURO|nr:hypothetical protein GJ744_009160 [Endocarpon pusillum]
MGTPLLIIGGISAVVQILQTAIDIANRVKSANDKKGLTMVINRNQKEVGSLKEIVTIVNEEKALQTKAIFAEVMERADLAEKLADLLKTMEDASFISKFANGKDQKEELSNSTGDIAKASRT